MNSVRHERPHTAGKALLMLENISKLYPGTVALNNVSVAIRAGECHGIIGKNGAGKTTLVKILSGVIAPTKGAIFIDGKPCHHLSRRQARKLGISIVTQEPQVIPEFSVAENLFFPDYPCRLGKQINWKAIQRKAAAILDQAGFPLALESNGADLSVSEQQLLLVIKAFFVDQNDIVILDEVTTALSRREQTYLFDLIDAQKQSGKAIVFISHRMPEIIRICDRITVLRDARKVASRERAEIDEQELSNLIVGDVRATQITRSKSPAASTGSAPLFAIERLALPGKFYDISLTLGQGEVVGLAGLRGSGRTDLMKTIAGVHRRYSGRLMLNGRSVRFNHPGEALGAGVAYLPEDRDREGLVEILSVKSNISLSSLVRYTRGLFVDGRKETQVAEELIGELDVKVTSHNQEVKTLSGGNRQKVVIARLMAAHPKVFLLDEPTKGIDIGAKHAILNTIRNELAKSGGIILTSPSVEDLMAVCDRIVVLYDGRVVAQFVRSEFNHNRIYLTLQGVDRTIAQEPVSANV